MRRVTVRGPADEEGTSEAVSCPVRTQCVSLSVCAACPRKVSLPDGDLDAVVCHHPEPPGRAEGERATRDLDLGEAMLRVSVGQILPSVLVVLSDALPLDEARAALDGAGALPVVSADGALVGLLTPADLEGAGGGAVVRDVMRREVDPLGEDQPVVHAVVRLAAGEPPLPVIAPDGHVVGIVCERDVLRWIARSLGHEV